MEKNKIYLIKTHQKNWGNKSLNSSPFSPSMSTIESRVFTCFEDAVKEAFTTTVFNYFVVLHSIDLENLFCEPVLYLYGNFNAKLSAMIWTSDIEEMELICTKFSKMANQWRIDASCPLMPKGEKEYATLNMAYTLTGEKLLSTYYKVMRGRK